MTHLYVYGIVDGEPHELDITGLDGERVFIVPFQDIGAAVSVTVETEALPTRKNLSCHLQTQKRLMQEMSLLPAAFSIITPNEQAIVKLMSSNYRWFKSNLVRLSGTEEVSVAAYWTKESMTEALSKTDPSFVELKRQLQAARENQTQILMELGMKVEKQSRRWQEEYGLPIHNALRMLALDSVLHTAVSAQCILNAAYLVNKDSESKFREKVYELDRKYGGKINFTYHSFLPPYSFIEIRIKEGELA